MDGRLCTIAWCAIAACMRLSCSLDGQPYLSLAWCCSSIRTNGINFVRACCFLVSSYALACALQEYLRFYTTVQLGHPETQPSRLDYLVNCCMERDFKGLRFLRHVGQQKAIAGMVKQLTAGSGSRTLVGFGDMGRADPGGLVKRCVRGPVAQLERALRQVCTVVSIDEFRTRKTCSQCHAQVKPMHTKVRPTPRRGGRLRRLQHHMDQESDSHGRFEIYPVRFCSNKSCNARMNRDINAARNILALLLAMVQGHTRPEPFVRGRPP